jgi:hypothetical protein
MDPIIQALTEQLTCYRRLAKLADIQHQHVQNSATDQLLDVLARRQEVLDQIGALEQLIRPAKRLWGDYLTTLVPGERETAERLLGETRALLEQITTADRNDAIVLQQRKITLSRQIHKATAARTINRNYAAAAYGTPAAQMDIISR